MRLHATETGHGPAAILLHGLYGRAQNLAAVARGLADVFRVISLDLRNHGASPHAAGMDYLSLAQDVRETLQEMGALPAMVVGHSMGGKTAMALALTHPEDVARLVVCDIAPVPYQHGNRAISDALQALPLTAGLTRKAADAALQAAVPDAGVRGFLLQNLVFEAMPHWRIGLAEIAAGLADIEGWPAALNQGRYTGPSLFLHGGASDFVLPAYHSQIRALFPSASFIPLPGAGHWLHADQPAAFLAQLRGFLIASKHLVQKT